MIFGAMKKHIPALAGLFCASLSCLPVGPSFGQSDSAQSLRPVHVRAEIGGLGATSSRTPFWLQANQFGTVPRSAPVGTIRLGSTAFFRNRSTPRGLFAGYGLDVVGNGASSSQLLLPEAYATVGVGRIELVAGRRKEVLGLVDTTLSSGSYSWSGNALPINKIQIGTRGFAPLPFTKGVLAVNAFFAHGWFPNTDSIQGSYLHQKAVYVRFGKPNWPVKLYAGLLHNAQWGGRSKYIDPRAVRDSVLPSSRQTYWYVITAQQPDKTIPDTYTEFDAVNRFGNHLGSIDAAAEVDLGRWNLFAYYQHPYDDKSGLAFKNSTDGLYGLRLRRRPVQSARSFQVTRLVAEILSTMNQSGPLVRQGRYDGQDDYFNNYQYLDGWAVDRRVLGTPFLARRQDIRPEWQTRTGNPWAIASNRVQAGYLGFTGVFPSGIEVMTRASFARHYGTYRAPFSGQATQFSSVVWVTWPLTWLADLKLRSAVAIDRGTLYQKSSGLWISVVKSL